MCSSGLMTSLIVLVATRGIERRGVELGVTERHLDHANIDVLLVAKLCRKVCSETRLLISAIWAAA